MRSVKIGSPVVFSTQHGVLVSAIVLACFPCQHGEIGEDELTEWDEPVGPTVNVAFADPDHTKTDSYGRQFKRETSVPHRGGSTAPGFWWALPEELID